jgi:hypothetical protein
LKSSDKHQRSAKNEPNRLEAGLSSREFSLIVLVLGCVREIDDELHHEVEEGVHHTGGDGEGTWRRGEERRVSAVVRGETEMNREGGEQTSRIQDEVRTCGDNT